MLAALRARVVRLEGSVRDRRSLDAIPICEGLPGDGLARAAVHDVLASSPGCGAGFCALLLARTGGTVIWIVLEQDGMRAWPPGLARFGLTPARLVLARSSRWSDALWAMEEALRCSAVSGAVLALPPEQTAGHHALDLTATRRLQLAAEAGGALGLLLRPDAGSVALSATTTRWRVSAHPVEAEAALDEGCWQLELLRAKTGRPGGPWAVTWDSATGQLVLAAAIPRSARQAVR
jgi:protein ImuA